MSAEGVNPLCGDELAVELDVDGDVVRDVRFNGRGCAISQAAASMISDVVKGKTVAEVRALGSEDVLEELGIPLSPIRLSSCGWVSQNCGPRSMFTWVLSPCAGLPFISKLRTPARCMLTREYGIHRSAISSRTIHGLTSAAARP